MDLQSFVLIIAALLVVVSLAEPFAQRVHLPSSVILAAIGIIIGAASALTARSADPAMAEFASLIDELPISSAVFLYVFLPPLLFHGALNVDARDMMRDGTTIFVLAVIAVVVTTLAVGFVLASFAGVPLIACLLVGAIVATTDPSAVLAIFRELGAPQRLTRLVEGESLSNDAVAITLFVIFMQFLLTGHGSSFAEVALQLVVTPIGGALLGVGGGWFIVTLFGAGQDNRLVEVSLTLALPYLAFILAEHWHLSGPIAVVAAGLVLSALGPARISPSSWRYVRDVWDQLAFWATSLVFVLAAILVPRLMVGFSWWDLLLCATLTLTALAARAAVLGGLLPILAALRLSPSMSRAYRIVILWGGLRGAVTLALALAVTESAGVPEEIKRFVAVLATGFVLFTLIVQGTTLNPLMRLLGLNRLGAVDQALRTQALAVAHADARQAIESTARSYALAPDVAAAVAHDYAAEREVAADGAEVGEVERLRIGLAALTQREQELVLEHLENRTLSADLVAHLLTGTRRLLDAARHEGLDGYRREAAQALAFGWRIRFGMILHSRLGLSIVIERQLATRFEMLLVHRIVIHSLFAFCEGQVRGLLGSTAADTAKGSLEERREAAVRALDALRLQYPDYADALERRFLRLAALRRERDGYDRLHAEGLIGSEVHRTLLQELISRAAADMRPKLDLKLSTGVLIRRVPLFQEFSDAEFDEVSRLMRPGFAIPGQRLITRGERGDAAWFIASGAVEVETGRGNVRLGRGDFFGELALLTGLPRQADVISIGYSDLLVLYATDFHTFLARHPNVGAHIARVAAERLGANRAGAPPVG